MVGLSHDDAVEGAREREFYNYYEPYLHYRSEDQSPFDKALAAFAQLAALRLNVRRVLISFFDRKDEYILAEATRSLSLQSNKATTPEDEVWAGTTVMKRPSTLCGHTYEITADKQSPSPLLDVITDMVHLESYPRMPPDTRFYAGVPITTSSGYHIGTFAAFDDTSRTGLTTEEVEFIQFMADTTMTHMEMVKGAEEHRRAAQMVSGLGSFVEGKASLEEWSPGGVSGGMPGGNTGNDTKNIESLGGRLGSSGLYAPTETVASATEGARRAQRTESSKDVQQGIPMQSELDTSGETLSSTPRSTPVPTDDAPPGPRSVGARSLQNQIVSDNVRGTFSRAANIIFKSIDVHGAAFFDASVGTFGGLVNELNNLDNSSRLTVKAGRDREEDNGKNNNEQEKICEILGYAAPEGNSLDARIISPDRFPVAESFLQNLLKEYPNGKIFNFDEGQQIPQSLHTENTPQSGDDLGEQVFPPDPPLDNSSDEESRRLQRQHDLRRLQQIFSGVRSLAFVPLWDSHRMRWYAGAIAWSCSPVRLLHQDSELSFIAAFGQCIMTEVTRLETAMADKAKSDLIGSISHELRSPLHGVLGNIECLEETQLDTFQQSLTHSIEACGRTLLDTMDHLLDFAKMNNFAEASNSNRSAERRDLGGESSTSTPISGMMKIDSDVDVAAITEEAVDAVFKGHDYTAIARSYDGRRNPSSQGGLRMHPEEDASSPERDVNVVLDISKIENVPWLMRVKPGAWRRIVTNITGNALKYTNRGTVHVKLDILPLLEAKKKPRSKIIFIVTDTGKGMSQEYLETKLFKAFSQEDPLLPGTGLGLSIVKQIVTSMGGDITVSSKQGYGTRVRVEINMLNSPFITESTQKPSPLSVTAARVNGLKATFFDSQEVAGLELYKATSNLSISDSRHLCMRSSFRTLTDWFGMETHYVTDLHNTSNTDMIVTTENAMKMVQGHAGRKDGYVVPILVLCDSVAHVRQNFAAKALQDTGGIAYFISQPVGPQTLSRSLAALFNGRAIPRFDPLQHDQESPGTAIATTSDTRDTQQKLAGPRLLLVDDNNINLQLLERFATSKKHTFISARDGLEAVEAYTKSSLQAKNIMTPAPFDVVLMDISMPNMDGLEATRCIRAFERSNRVKATTIIALTGLASASAQQEAYTSGVDLFLTKPVRLKELNKLLEKHGK